MLEPYDGKLSRTVLRREGGGNTADPADPDAGGAELAAEQPRQRHDEDDVAAEGDDQRGRTLAQTFQRAVSVIGTGCSLRKTRS